ncbi:hypothetical protein ACFQ07_02455 [Actinomadura adrarensis]|uniref:Uncharacterized protein n=1 Tax=Actinomadura adrarensis TaxID=1819600 RepID=A0ABW3CAW1_9ACTN
MEERSASLHAAEDLLQSPLARTAARWRHVESSPEAYVRRAPQPGLTKKST